MEPGATVLPPIRHFELDGPVNFRDLGGYPAADDRSVRWRTVFRSDGLETVSAADRRVLVEELGIGTIIDLRSNGEGEELGRFDVDGTAVRLHHVPILDETKRLVEDAGRDFTIGHLYVRMIEDSADRFVRALRLVGSSEGPTVFHCAAGKDRTGLLAALLLGVLGVADSDIVEDYAHSARIVAVLRQRFQARIEADRAEGAGPARAEGWERVAEEMLSARAETMTETLDRLRGGFGSIPGWAAAHGLSEAELRGLRARLLVAQAD